jgi:hypothetical protein
LSAIVGKRTGFYENVRSGLQRNSLSPSPITEKILWIAEKSLSGMLYLVYLIKRKKP